MKRLLISAIFMAVVLSFAAAPDARAWGCEGHQTIALIAKMNLDPRALAMVLQILQDNPIDPKMSRFCQPVSKDLMADAANWADDYRNIHKETTGWHFIDIPRGAGRQKIGQYCPASTSCITAALAAQIAILKSTDSDSAQKADALRFVIHFVGDIHQPLHTTNNNDKGGHCIPVSYPDEPTKDTKPEVGDYYPELHTAWDSGMIYRIAQGKTVDQFAAELNQQFQSKIKTWQREGLIFDEWAWESHQLAEKVAYGDLPVAVPIEKPVAVSECTDDNHISDRMAKLNEVLGPDYLNAVTPVIEEQLAKAGIRLSMILNQIWP